MPPEEIVERQPKTLDQLNARSNEIVDKIIAAAERDALVFTQEVKELFLDIELLPEGEQKAAVALFAVAVARFNSAQNRITAKMEEAFNA